MYFLINELVFAFILSESLFQTGNYMCAHQLSCHHFTVSFFHSAFFFI